MFDLEEFEVQQISFYDRRLREAKNTIEWCENHLIILLSKNCDSCSNQNACWNNKFDSLLIVKDHCINKRNKIVDKNLERTL